MTRETMFKVMFVDDEPWVIIGVLNNIPWQTLGFEAIGHYNKSREAKKAILSERPHVVFVDINMPVMDGFELIHQCRQEGSDAAFVILTAYPDFEFARKAIRESVLDYCLKPVYPAALIKTLERIRILLNQKADSLGGKDEIKAPPPRAKQYVPENEERFNRIISYIKSHYTEKVLLRDLAEKFCFNKNYICSLFKKYTGGTFSQYILKLRIDESKKLLESTNLPLRVIAEETGFSDNCYFNRVFKAICDIPPHHYRLRKGKEPLGTNEG
jgi:two-component system response regulator YesN